MNATVDWRTKGWVTPIKDQGRCGSCYAFSAVGALEGQYKNLTGNLTELSTQQVVDCSKSYLNDGCEGGRPDWVYDYIMYNGLETEKDYPYIDNEGRCKADLRKYAVRTSHYWYVRPENPTQLKAALNFVGPISVAVGTGLYEAFDWAEYESGIIDKHQLCPPDLDHSVLLVGYGSSTVGKTKREYWIIKNSWGTDWGEKGYIRLLITAG